MFLTILGSSCQPTKFFSPYVLRLTSSVRLLNIDADLTLNCLLRMLRRGVVDTGNLFV